jgi:hypothetical protein
MYGFGRSRSGSPKVLQHSHFEVAKMETASRDHVFNLPGTRTVHFIDKIFTI